MAYIAHSNNVTTGYNYPGELLNCQLSLGVRSGCFAVLVGGLSNPIEPFFFVYNIICNKCRDTIVAIMLIVNASYYY